MGPQDPKPRCLRAAAAHLSALPFRKGLNPLSVAPGFEDDILTMMTHGNYHAYFKQFDVNWSEHYPTTADLPMLLVSGWYDSHCGGTLENYVGLGKHLTSPVHLVIGPWVHGANTRSHSGEVEFGPEVSIPDFQREFHLKWFDRFLKGKSPSLAAAWPPVRIFVMGTGEGRKDAGGRLRHGGYWRDEDAWPQRKLTSTSSRRSGISARRSSPIRRNSRSTALRCSSSSAR